MKDFEFKQINKKIPLLLNKNDSGLIFILILFNVGSVYENSDVAGISHFLEHIIFGSSKNFNGNNIPIKYMGNNAINYNAFTSKENTGFFLESNKKNFKKMLNIIYDILVNPLFDIDEIEKERKIVFEEKANMKDSPHEIAAEEYYEILFKDDVLSKTIIGTDESLNNIKREDLINYFNKFYKNLNNISICLSGDYDNSFINLLNHKFSNFSKDTINYKQKYLKYKIKYIKQNGGNLIGLLGGINLLSTNLFSEKEDNNKNYTLPYHHNIIKDKFDKTYIILNYKCDINDEYTLDLISNLLTHSLSSILSYQLREHYNLVYGINSESNIYTHKGYFSIYTNTEKYDCVKLIIDTIIKALDDLKQYKIQDLKTKTYNNIEEELLNSNKLKIENGLLALQLSHSSLGSYMTRQFFLYKNRQKNKIINNFPEHLQIKNVIKTYNSITKQNIIDVSKKTFIPENLCISTVSAQKISNYFS
jgi:predicted Zn-dependent peptidase